MIRFFEKTKASISIFLILVLTPMYTCVYLAIDSARYSAAKAKISGAMELSGNAALADYDIDMKELYGLFVMSNTEEDLTDNMTSFFTNMIDSSELSLGDTTLTRKIIGSAVGSVFENTVNTSTSDISTSYVQESGIYNPTVMENYIRNYMKYRAPYMWAHGLSQKVSAFIDIETLSETKPDSSSESETVAEEGEADDIKSAKEQYEAVKAISETSITDIGADVSSEDIPDLVATSILDTIADGTSSSSISIDDFSVLEDAINNVYEMEYITSMFGCLTTSTTDETLMGEEFGTRPVLNSEIEYIIFGKDSTDSNISLSVDLIFALRVIFNTVYVYTNANMRQSALVLATAIAGWTGFGIPLTQNAILIAWATAESILDVASLCDGETVPIYKSASTWTLGLSGAKTILADGAKNYACKAIDDVFAVIENVAVDDVDGIKDAALSYMNQSGQSAVESLTSAIVTPVEKAITDLTSDTKVDYTEDEIEQILLDAVNSVDATSTGLQKAKQLFIDNCLPTISSKVYSNLADIFSDDETVADAAGSAIENAISDAYSTLFSKVESLVDDFVTDGEDEITTLIDNGSSKLKDETISVIDDYSEKLSEFMGEEEESSVTSSSGIGMTYLDYLKIFTFIGLNSSSGKTNMLKRCAVIMQINCQERNSNFDITQCFTAVKICSVTDVASHTINVEEVYQY